MPVVSTIRVTERKIVRINDKCPKNPVYLAWFNLIGGIDYWLFSITQTQRLRTGGRVLFEKDITDLEGADSTMEFLGKEANRSFNIGDENLDENDIDGIEGMLMATKVQILVGQNPIKWQTVLIKPGTFTIKETGEKRHKIQLTIDKPEIIIPSQ